MRATDLLRRQHDDVQELFDKLRTAAPKERGKIVGQLSVVLRAHSRVEEELLYPRFHDKEGFEEIITTSYDQHDHELAALSDLERCAVDDASFKRLADETERLAREHFALEENEVLPRIDRLWTADMLEELGGEMKKRFDQLCEGVPEARV
jgi:hypothetical protein